MAGVRAGQCSAFCRFCRPADIYAVLTSTPPRISFPNVQTELLTESDLTGAFTQDGAAGRRGLVYGEAAAVQHTAHHPDDALTPLQVSTLDALRTRILSDMKATSWKMPPPSRAHWRTTSAPLP